MGDIYNNFLNHEQLEQWVQRLLTETKVAIERYLDASALIFIQIVQNKFPEFAQDNSVIYHACLRFLDKNPKLHPIHYLKPTDSDEFAIMHYMRHMCGLVPGAESSHFKHHILKAFGGTVPVMSQRLADASKTLQQVISHSNGYSSEKRNLVRFYIWHEDRMYPLDAKDKNLLILHSAVLATAFGIRILKHQRSGDAIIDYGPVV